MKPIFQLCYDYLIQRLLWDSPRESPECWMMSVLGEEQTPEQSVPGSVCFQSVLLLQFSWALRWEHPHTARGPTGMAPKLSRTSAAGRASVHHRLLWH